MWESLRDRNGNTVYKTNLSTVYMAQLEVKLRTKIIYHVYRSCISLCPDKSSFSTNFVVVWCGLGRQHGVRAYLGSARYIRSFKFTDKGQKNQENNLAVNFGLSLLN